ncbi:MAG: hypothetical protein ACRDSH_01755 [Pseudonocardiaceae bacterium]
MRTVGAGMVDRRRHRRVGRGAHLSLEYLWGAELTPSSAPSGTGADPFLAVWVTSTGRIDTAALLPTDPRLAVLGLIAYGSSTTLTAPELLKVTELTPRLVRWTTTETDGWPNLCATRVAAAFGRCRDIVDGTAVFTGALDITANPTSLTAAQAAHVRDLT